MTVDRLGTFVDLVPILDAALAHGGGTYTLPDHGKAVNWRHRCYKFRKAYAAKFPNDIKYDQLSFPQLSTTSCEVIIKVVKPLGTFTPAGPATNPVPTAATAEDADLLAQALALGEAKGIGDVL